MEVKLGDVTYFFACFYEFKGTEDASVIAKVLFPSVKISSYVSICLNNRAVDGLHCAIFCSLKVFYFLFVLGFHINKKHFVSLKTNKICLPKY